MKKEVKMYTIVCDNCKNDAGSESDYSCWNDENAAEDVAIESDWLKDDNKHYCPDCYDYDQYDNIVISAERKDRYANL